MTNAIRLVSGGAIQVRTGVLQGIGPQGPRGLVGPAGPQGDQGNQGPVGPQGAISQYMMQAAVTTATSLLSGTAAMIQFGTPTSDDISAYSSATNFILHELGDYHVNAWLRFTAPAGGADGSRQMYLNVTTIGNPIYVQVNAVVADFTYINLSWPVRTSVADQMIRIYGKSTDNETVQVQAGGISIVRLGSGPKGTTGDPGPTGPVGPQGPPGIQGPVGNANSGFATYADLL